MNVLTTFVDSPVGPLFVAADAQGLRAIEFRDNRHPVRRGADWREGDSALLRTARKINESAFGLLTDIVNRLEGAALVVIAQGQQTSDRVAELAAQASQAAVGSRGLNGSARV